MHKLKQNRELAGMPTYKHRLFFEFLQISPSYDLAHQYRHKKISQKVFKNLPKDFDKVLMLYDKIGDVNRISFDDWWDKAGITLLAPDRKKAKIIYQINLTKPKEKILKEFQQFIDDINFKPFNPIAPQISFLNNRMHVATLVDRHLLVIERSKLGLNKTTDKSSKVPYWKMASESQISTSNIRFGKALPQILKDESKRKSNKKKKNYLTMLISKNLKEALYISENAARGVFPCKEPVLDCLEFDYLKIFSWHDKYLDIFLSTAGKKAYQGRDVYVPGGYRRDRIGEVLNRERKKYIRNKYKDQFEEKGYAEFKERIPGTKQFRKVILMG